MKITISQCKHALTEFFLYHSYPKEIASLMATALVRSELFHKVTHGIHRASWIVTKDISKNTEMIFTEVCKNVTIVDCLGSNGYFCAQKAVEKNIESHKYNDFHITILKNIFPTNALIDYLEQFQYNKLGAIIMTTTPYLVGMEGSGEKILGTNPFGYTFPNDITNIISDMATSNITFGELLNNYQNINEKVVLNLNGEKDIPKNSFDGHIFSGSLLPFGGEKGEHKGFIISLFIELVTSALVGNRSQDGDMIIFSFSSSWNCYQRQGINHVLQKMCTAKNIRIPGSQSYHHYQENLKNNIVEIDDKNFKILKNFL